MMALDQVTALADGQNGNSVEPQSEGPLRSGGTMFPRALGHMHGPLCTWLPALGVGCA